MRCSASAASPTSSSPRTASASPSSGSRADRRVPARAKQAVRARFDRLETDARRVGNGARLFSRIAWVLPASTACRRCAAASARCAWTPADATAAFVKLIAGLLGGGVRGGRRRHRSGDLARAGGACSISCRARSSPGRNAPAAPPLSRPAAATPARQQQWLHLIDSQERCFQVFAEFSRSRGAARSRGRPARPAAALARTGAPAPHRLHAPAGGRARCRAEPRPGSTAAPAASTPCNVVEDAAGRRPAQPVRPQDRAGARRTAGPARRCWTTARRRRSPSRGSGAQAAPRPTAASSSVRSSTWCRSSRAACRP